MYLISYSLIACFRKASIALKKHEVPLHFSGDAISQAGGRLA
jgi:hypothetical protein